MKTRATLYTVALAAAALTLTACEDTTTSGKPDTPATTPASSPSQPASDAMDDAMAAAGIPKEPTGADRTALLKALAEAAPDVVRYEGKAIDAARNQCSALNNGAKRLDYLASQRFTYKDVSTSEAQGAKLNAALKASGFCKV